MHHHYNGFEKTHTSLPFSLTHDKQKFSTGATKQRRIFPFPPPQKLPTILLGLHLFSRRKNTVKRARDSRRRCLVYLRQEQQRWPVGGGDEQRRGEARRVTQSMRIVGGVSLATVLEVRPEKEPRQNFVQLHCGQEQEPGARRPVSFVG